MITGIAILCVTAIILTYMHFDDKNSCKHKWVIKETIHVLDDKNQKIGNRVILQCTHCGDVKRKQFI